MRQYKTEAIILDTTDVFDADRSFMVFTREYGKIRARAKGVRKPTSKLTGHLLSYLPTQLEMVESGGWYLIVQAHMDVSEGEGRLPADPLAFLQVAATVAEVINRLFIEHDSHPAIYDGLAYTLNRLRELTEQGEQAKTQLVMAEFLFKCLGELGYRPELSVCVETGQPLSADFVGWSSQRGGVVSKAGFATIQNEAMPLRFPQTVVALRQFAKPEFWAEHLKMSDEVRSEVSKVVLHYVQTQIGQPLKSIR